MTTIYADELEVCEDCAHVLANDEGTAEHRAAMAATWATVPGVQLVLACDEDEENCATFSSRHCDGCNDELAGSRHAAAALL